MFRFHVHEYYHRCRSLGYIWPHSRALQPDVTQTNRIQDVCSCGKDQIRKYDLDRKTPILAQPQRATPSNLMILASLQVAKQRKMTKHGRKRQKISKDETAQPPLGSNVTSLLTDDARKDDEERRLESMLFGVPYAPSTSHTKKNGDQTGFVITDEEEDGDADAAAAGPTIRELEHMLDSDVCTLSTKRIRVAVSGGLRLPVQLFFIDDGAAPSSKDAAATVYGETSHRSDSEDDDSGEEVDEADHSPHDASESETTPVLITGQTTSPGDAPRRPRKAPAWTDPDDANLQISLTAHNRLRKLRDAPSEDMVTGPEYERKLRRQFERINPTPEWAEKARKKSQSSKRRRSGSDVDEGVEDILPGLLASTGGISAEKKTSVLAQGVISISRLRDANQAATAEGEIKSVQFHPSPQIPVLLTASTDRRLRLFHVCFFFPISSPPFFFYIFVPLFVSFTHTHVSHLLFKSIACRLMVSRTLTHKLSTSPRFQSLMPYFTQVALPSS